MECMVRTVNFTYLAIFEDIISRDPARGERFYPSVIQIWFDSAHPTTQRPGRRELKNTMTCQMHLVGVILTKLCMSTDLS